MGKQLAHYVTQIRCDHRGCDAAVELYVRDAPEELEPVLRRLAVRGWAFLVQGRMASYCPEHANEAFKCRCRSRVKRGVCPVHSGLPIGEAVIFNNRLRGVA